MKVNSGKFHNLSRIKSAFDVHLEGHVLCLARVKSFLESQ